jgi:type II secretory pathway pseudopilin PulG
VSALAPFEEARMTTTRQHGFSLVELLVAMLVTMVVSGAVFGLMTVGQGTFYREPALTERQQNIRVAMDMIQRDIAHAGAGMGRFQQAFTVGDGVGETAPLLNGLAGTRGLTITPSGQAPDDLEITGTIDCPAVPLARTPGANTTTTIGFPPCYPEPGMVAIIFEPPDDNALWGLAFNAHAGSMSFNYPPGQQPPKSQIGNPNDLDRAIAVVPVQIVRYEIAAEPDGVPGLWRSARGGIDPGSGNRVHAPNPLGGWQLVARGIEDLQVAYAPGNGVWAASPPIAVVDDFTTVTRDVEVTLWARAIGVNLKGAMVPSGASAGLVPAVRGSAVTVTTPRQALLTLLDPASPLSHKWR